MDQELALEILMAGHNTLLTGPAGSGKTYVLNQFIKEAKRAGKNVAVTATTGLAATHLNGNTIHSWSGIGIHDKLPNNFHEHLTKSRTDQIQKADILIIDEISMLHDYRLDMIDEITRNVRNVDEPFGGLQVVLCGDFFQLPPVERGEGSGNFVTSSNAWEYFDPIVCYLTEQHRQNDDEYLNILNALRENDLRKKHLQSLLARQTNNEDSGEITELHTTNVNVDLINNKKLSSLSGETHEYKMDTTGSKNYIENLKRSCLAQEILVLKNGALVMCIKNNQEKKYVNGSLGQIVGFDKESGYPRVELKNGRVITIEPESWELRDGDKKRAGLTQIPLRLAWAITVHKSQGMTLDAARIDLRKAFVEGMGYVALSRVKSLDTLSLAGLNQMALRVSADALELDITLKKLSAKHSDKYENLRENKNKRSAEKTKIVKGNWADKLVTMRSKYPNAYKPWVDSDDKKLVTMFSTGKKIKVKDLSDTFGRHPGSIRARIKKHFGEDALDTHTIKQK